MSSYFTTLLIIIISLVSVECCNKKVYGICDYEPPAYVTFGSRGTIHCLSPASAPSSLAINTGDIIRCSMNPAYHYLLATNTTHVVHISGVTSKNIASIKEESFSTAAGKYSMCELNNDCVNCNMKKRNVGAYSNDVAVKRAQSSVQKYHGQTVYYSLTTCNCEHWVVYWKYGEAYSGQGSFGSWRNGKTNYPTCAI